MPLNVDQFAKAISQAGLLSADELSALKNTIQASETEQFARELIKRRKLTRFQAQMVYQGKGKSLTLGNYLLIDKIGQGGMGQVYLAEHRRMKRRVALKVLPAHLVHSSKAVERFHREVEAAGRVSHPNIVTAYDADEAKGIHYFVMEYVEGKDLASLVRGTGPLPVERAIECVIQAARGLQYAHDQGIVHRDVKPGNMLLSTEGQVKILDLGLACLSDSEGVADHGLTGTGIIMGTLDFMAPEQGVNTKHADARSDLYSLGATLYYLLTGLPLYKGESPVEKILAHREQPIPNLQAKRPDVPATLVPVFQKMVAKQPEDRYQTMTQSITALEQVLQPVQAETLAGSQTNQDSALQKFLELQEIESMPTVLEPPPQAPAVKRTTAQHETLQSGFLVDTETVQQRARKPPSRQGSGTLLLGAGLFGALLLLGGIIITITNKDGTKTTINVPEGATVDVTEVPATPASTAPISPDHAAAEWVLSVGGKVTLIDWKGQTQSLTKGPVPNDDSELQAVDLTGCQQVTDEDLKRFEKCQRLQTLNLSDTPVTGTGLKYLPPVTSLRELYLNSTQLTDENAWSLRDLNQITTLELFGCTLITDQALISVGKLHHLERLNLGNCEQLTDEGVNHLNELNNLLRLAIGYTNITDTGMEKLLTWNPHLVLIDIGGKSQSANPLVEAHSLKHLGTSGELITDKALPVLQSLPSLSSIQIGSPLNQSVVERLPHLSKVTKICLFFNRDHEQGPGDAGYAALAKHPTLTDLKIMGAGQSPTDAALASLAKLPSLKTFKLEFSEQYNKRNYTPAGIEAFRKARPEVHLTVDGVDYPAIETANAGDNDP